MMRRRTGRPSRTEFVLSFRRTFGCFFFVFGSMCEKFSSPALAESSHHALGRGPSLAHAPFSFFRPHSHSHNGQERRKDSFGTMPSSPLSLADYPELPNKCLPFPVFYLGSHNGTRAAQGAVQGRQGSGHNAFLPVFYLGSHNGTRAAQGARFWAQCLPVSHKTQSKAGFWAQCLPPPAFYPRLTKYHHHKSHKMG